MKQLFKKAYWDGKDPWLALLDHRDTPTEGVDASPAQRLMSRRTCTLVPTLSLYSSLKSFKFCIEAQVEKEKKPSFTMIFRQSSYQNFKLDKKSEWVPSITQRSLVETWYLHREAFGQIIRHTIRWQHTEKKQAVSQTHWTTRQGACWCQCTCYGMQPQRDTPRTCDIRANPKFSKLPWARLPLWESFKWKIAQTLLTSFQ